MNKDFFEILRKLEKNPILTQREIAKELNLSLGKINYCLQELKKGFNKDVKLFKI